MRIFTIATLLGAALVAHLPQSQSTIPTPLPVVKADVGAWDVQIIRRAALMIATPAVWDRADTGDCPGGGVKIFSLTCALQYAADDAGAHQPAQSECRLRAFTDGLEGSCGPLFDEVSIFTLTRVPAITTGIWRRDAKPEGVWAGTMSDAASPIMYEARQLINSVTTKKYPAGLAGYNNDPATTFEDIQRFFHLLEDRVVTNGAADLGHSTDDVEIEIYAGGAGVMRTYAGWFPVSGFTASDSAVSFRLSGKDEVAPNAVDREILERAAAIIASDAVWNRADNRKCPSGAATWSIYCAVEQAQIAVAGGFHHRRPAGELVREIVEARTKDRKYSHRMMDYNNDPKTTLADVKSLFAEAMSRIK